MEKISSKTSHRTRMFNNWIPEIIIFFAGVGISPQHFPIKRRNRLHLTPTWRTAGKIFDVFNKLEINFVWNSLLKFRWSLKNWQIDMKVWTNFWSNLNLKRKIIWTLSDFFIVSVWLSINIHIVPLWGSFMYDCLWWNQPGWVWNLTRIFSPRTTMAAATAPPRGQLMNK